MFLDMTYQVVAPRGFPVKCISMCVDFLTCFVQGCAGTFGKGPFHHIVQVCIFVFFI